MTRTHIATFVLIVMVVSGASALTGCAMFGLGNDSTGADTWEHRTWQAFEISGYTMVGSEGARPTLEFDPEASRVAGRGGVNRYFGQYEREDDMLRLTQLATTRMAGPPAKMDLEHAYLEALEQVDRWRLDRRGRLVLSAGDAVLIRFEAVP